MRTGAKACPGSAAPQTHLHWREAWCPARQTGTAQCAAAGVEAVAAVAAVEAAVRVVVAAVLMAPIEAEMLANVQVPGAFAGSSARHPTPVGMLADMTDSADVQAWEFRHQNLTQAQYPNILLRITFEGAKRRQRGETTFMRSENSMQLLTLESDTKE